jgi:hypothetical protein
MPNSPSTLVPYGEGDGLALNMLEMSSLTDRTETPNSSFWIVIPMGPRQRPFDAATVALFSTRAEFRQAFPGIVVGDYHEYAKGHP